MPRRTAPPWINAAIGLFLVVAVAPGWLYAAGYLTTAILFSGGQPAPQVRMTTWPRYFRHHRQVPKVALALTLGGFGATLPLLAAAALALRRPKRSLHGDAKWGARRDAARAHLLGTADDGILIGRLGREYLSARLDHHPHVMLAAPTGSGKGVGVVIPNLLNWNHSVIVLDIKLENWTLTAGFRARHGHAVYLFNPLSPERLTHRWNPLAYISPDPDLRVDDIQAIGQILFPDIDGVDPIWSASCRSLFTGLVLYLIETPGKPVTLGQVAREAYSGEDGRWPRIIAARRAEGRPLSAACVAALLDYVNTSDNTRTSIRKTFTSRFDLFTNPIIDAATCANDFDISAVRKRRMSIYLGITPNTLERLAPLLNLFFQQVIDLNTRELPEHNPELKYQCLLLPDEFRSLGRMNVLVNGIAFFRGYGLRMLPIFQAPSQVREVYGEEAAKTFFKNHHVRIVYTPADIDDAGEISRELGNVTYKATSRSKPMAFSKGGKSKSETDQARALLLPQEVKEIGDEEAIVFAKGCKPLRVRKIRWYREAVFTRRVCDPPRLTPAPLPAAAPIETPPEAGDKAGDEAEAGEWIAPDGEEMETLYDRPLSDFSLEFDPEMAQGELSAAEARALADRIYAKHVRPQ